MASSKPAVDKIRNQTFNGWGRFGYLVTSARLISSTSDFLRSSVEPEFCIGLLLIPLPVSLISLL